MRVYHLRRAWRRRLDELRHDVSAARLHTDPLGDVARAVLVLGSVRSGSTKLAESLASARSTRLVFEPFNPAGSPYAADGFPAGGYLPPDAREPALRERWTRVLAGRVRSPWTDSRNRARVATRRVVKCVAANNLSGWLRRQFPATPVVFVYRHPIAVAESIAHLESRSRAQGGGRPFPWSPADTERLATTSGLLDGPLAPLADEVHRRLRDARTPVVDHVLRWCLENHTPLTTAAGAGVEVVRFEELVARPEEHLRRIGRHVGLGVERGVRQFDVPSSTDWATGHGDRDGSRRSRTDGWRTRVGAADQAAALEVVEAFGLGAYLGDA